MAKDKEKKELTHIQVKDNGLIISSKIGSELSGLKSLLQNGIIKGLINGSDSSSITRYKIAQNNNLENFKLKANKVIKETKKSVKNTLKNDKTVNLTDKQVNQMSKDIDKGLLYLQQSAVKTYRNTLDNVFLKVKSASDLKEQLEKHIQPGVNVGVVYKNGREYKFDSYWEMKTRTDIQQEIGKNMVDAGAKGGVIFYLAAYFGDCAKDHVDYQGKIYYDKNWRNIAPKDRLDEIEDYIANNCEMSVQDVMDEKGNYLTTRPNCRHYFSYVDIDSVLGAKTDKELSQLRDKMNLNFNGKYRPEKYKALQQQRANERKIRAEKEEITKNEFSLHLNPDKYKELQTKIKIGEANVRRYQAEQRNLIKQYNNLERRYDREALGNRVELGTNKTINSNGVDTVYEYNVNKGQGANNNFSGIEEHPKPAFIKNIDINNRNEIENVLNDFKKEYNNLDKENAIIISSKGEVYRCYGIKDRVFADTDLPEEVLKGSIFIHNHPKDVTSYSFSQDDLRSYIKFNIKEMYGMDDKYEYSFKRNGQKTKSSNKNVFEMTFEDFQDWNIREILKDSDIYYERKIKAQ